jgi:hypothetical protein
MFTSVSSTDSPACNRVCHVVTSLQQNMGGDRARIDAGTLVPLNPLEGTIHPLKKDLPGSSRFYLAREWPSGFLNENKWGVAALYKQRHPFLQAACPMLTRIVEVTLNCTLLAVHVLYRLRNYLRSREPAAREEDRLMSEWLAANKSLADLKDKLDHPTASRPNPRQVELWQLWQATLDARDKCSMAVRALRVYRNAQHGSL